jgi:hypothetical protein
MASEIRRREAADRALSAVCKQFTAALALGLGRARPEAVIDEKGYVLSPEENLLPGVNLADFESDLRQGAGGELEGKFCAAHSSSALAVNCFAPFRQRRSTFDLGRHHGLRLVGFEQRFPTGLQGTPPHIDVVAEGPSGLVAIESKCTEYLLLKEPKFSVSYDIGIQDARASGPWFAEMRRQRASGSPQQLDVAQLIKHAFGLARGREDQPVTLVYLYLEPVDAEGSPFFSRHRDEVAAFAKQVAGGYPAFEAMTYAELWDVWAASPDDWLAAHVRELRERYEVRAFSWGE